MIFYRELYLNKDKNVQRYESKRGKERESLGYKDTLYLNKDSKKNNQSIMTLR